MRVLLIAWGFPPSRMSGVHRAVAISRWLVDNDHEATALTADREFFEVNSGVDPALARNLPSGLRVVRVPFPNNEDPVINRWPRKRATKPRTWVRERNRGTVTMFPERFYGTWRDRVVSAAHRLQRETPFDLVIATGSPYVDFAAAQSLHTYHGVPYLMDDRDSFLYSVYTGEPQAQFDRIRPWWEALASSALECWFVNPPIADLYREAYPELADRIRVVENGWDPVYLDPGAIAEPAGDPPVFGYVGTVNVKFPLAALLDGWHSARGSVLPADAELRIFGGIGYRHQPEKHRQALKHATGVRVMGNIPKPEIGGAYGQCDVLVFTREGGALVTTSKIYEYLATGRPIAAVIPAEHDSRRVLADYPRAHISEPGDDGAWQQALGDAYRDATTADPGRVRRAREWGARFRRDQVLAPAMQRLLAQVSDRNSD